MPNRVVREGWLDSPRIDSLDAASERFFLRLILKADDFGRYTANPVALTNTLFPLKEAIRSTDSSRFLAACEKAGLVRCYETPKGRFLEIREFNQRTRAAVSKYPAPDGDPPPECPTDDGHLTAPRLTSAHGGVFGGGGEGGDGGECAQARGLPPPPKFASLSGKFPKELGDLLKYSRTELKRLIESEALTERVLKPDVADLVALLEREGKADRVSEAKARPDAWTRRLTPAGLAHRKAWAEQIKRIEDALKGIA